MVFHHSSPSRLKEMEWKSVVLICCDGSGGDCYCCFWGRILCFSSGWPWTHLVAQAGFKFGILLPQDYSHELPCLKENAFYRDSWFHGLYQKLNLLEVQDQSSRRKQEKYKPGIVIHTCNPSTLKAQAGGSIVTNQPRPHRDILSINSQIKKERIILMPCDDNAYISHFTLTQQ